MITSGGVPCQLPEAINDSLFDLFRRADIVVVPDEKYKHQVYLSKGPERLWAGFSTMINGSRIFIWSPDSSGYSLGREVERICFASGGDLGVCPSTELYVSVHKQVSFSEMTAEIQAKLGCRGISNKGAATSRLPEGVVLHQGPAADPRTCSALSYVALDYPKICLHPFRRHRVLRQVREIFRGFGFARMP